MTRRCESLRQYLQKGGFLIVDDFHFPNEWNVFEAAMRRVVPDARIERLDIKHPVFNSFFQIDSLDVPYPGRLGEQGLMGEFYGIHEENDPRRRLTVIINYNIDVGDYVEWSGENLYNPASTNEAYKFAINYIIYGMTHRAEGLRYRHSRSFVSDPVLDDDVDALQQRDVAQHVAADRDDVRVLARRHGADLRSPPSSPPPASRSRRAAPSSDRRRSRSPTRPARARSSGCGSSSGCRCRCRSAR